MKKDYLTIGTFFRTESDLMMEALRRQLLSEFESQKRAQADSFVAELATNMRQFNGDWEKRLEAVSKAWSEERSQLISRLEIAQATEERLESRVQQLAAIMQDWAGEEGDNWWTDEKTGSDKKEALVNHVLVTECVIRLYRALLIMKLTATMAIRMWVRMLLVA